MRPEIAPGDVARVRVDIEQGKTAADEKTGFRGRAIVRGGRGISNRTINVLQAMLTWAGGRSLADGNPAIGVRRTKTQRSERFLSSPEAARLPDALDTLTDEGAVNPAYIAIARLLLFSGARRSEIVGLQWREVDLDRGSILLPPERHKTGEKTGAKRIPLAQAALDILAAQPQVGPYVFPALRDTGRPTAPTSGLTKAWNRIRQRAELSDLRLHDLRHSFASFGVVRARGRLRPRLKPGHHLDFTRLPRGDL